MFLYFGMDEYTRGPKTYCQSASIRTSPTQIHFSADLFNSVAQGGICGCGAWLRIRSWSLYKLCWSGGPNTDTGAEIMALRGLLWFSKRLQLDHIFIYGDSKALIDKILGQTNFAPPYKSCWLCRIKQLNSVLSPCLFIIYTGNQTLWWMVYQKDFMQLWASFATTILWMVLLRRKGNGDSFFLSSAWIFKYMRSPSYFAGRFYVYGQMYWTFAFFLWIKNEV